MEFASLVGAYESGVVVDCVLVNAEEGVPVGVVDYFCDSPNCFGRVDWFHQIGSKETRPLGSGGIVLIYLRLSVWLALEPPDWRCLHREDPH